MEQKDEQEYGEEDMMVAADEEAHDMEGNGEDEEEEGLSGIGNVDVEAEDEEGADNNQQLTYEMMDKRICGDLSK